MTPTSVVVPYELLLVVDHDLWERPAGRALFNVLDTDVPGLPQSERSFKIMYTALRDYDTTLKLIRNIIIVDIQRRICKPSLNTLATYTGVVPQIILTIQAPNEQEFEVCK